ncbi:fascin domain-containing protein [Polyangium sorediatum]|uniref:Uncharacterized protein n=1 Tax=Polyangium sorediatum TaxID=889274 RepID=A0ABT6NMS2_9BACT|nr:hypothetical protein [Polyangium sorediatum]MDI1429604.1 hypothetical protein [Polyangium sorediatum]
MKQKPSRRVLPLSLSLLIAALSPVGCAADVGAPLEEEELSEARQELQMPRGLYVVANDAIHKRGALGPATGNDWYAQLTVHGVTAMAIHHGELYVVAGNELYKRDALHSGNWIHVGPAWGATAMASYNGSLYMTTDTGLFRRGATGPETGNDWTYVGSAYGVTGMAAHDGSLIVASNNKLWRRNAIGATPGTEWTYVGDVSGATGLTSYNGSLYAAANNGIWKRGKIGHETGNDWSYVGEAYGVVSMAASGDSAQVLGPARCGDRVRLRSKMGDYLHRPEGPERATTWGSGIGNVWTVECMNNGNIQLRSRLGDYLHRAGAGAYPPITTHSQQGEWTVVPTANGRFKLRSSQNDYLSRTNQNDGLLLASSGHDEWTAEVIAMGAAACNDVVRLRSSQGDYLTRPDTPYGVAAAPAGVGSAWVIECTDNGTIQLRSWKGDYLHRPDGPEGVTTWDQGGWKVESLWTETVRLRSWKGDFLKRAATSPGITTGNADAGTGEWLVQPFVDPAPVPKMRLANEDVDDDGTRELLLVVENPGGGGYAVSDPFVIAEALPHLGYSLGTGRDFWDSLSPIQQKSLHTTVSEILPSQELGTAIEVNELLSGRAMLPTAGRTYEVSWFDGDFETSRGNIKVSGSVLTAGCSWNALGGIPYNTEVQLVSGAAAVSFTDTGVAFGAEANLVVLTRGVGDPDGTTGAVNIGAGVGLYGELKYGQNGQYGFNVPLVVIPVGVSVYVKGEDAVDAWNAVRGWSGGGTFEASRHVTQWGIDWTHQGSLVAMNAFDDSALVVNHMAGNTYIRAVDASRETLIWLQGTQPVVGGAINTAVHQISDEMISPTGNAAAELVIWSKSAGSVVESGFDTVEGWISSTVADAADWFCGWLGC